MATSSVKYKHVGINIKDGILDSIFAYLAKRIKADPMFLSKGIVDDIVWQLGVSGSGTMDFILDNYVHEKEDKSRILSFLLDFVQNTQEMSHQQFLNWLNQVRMDLGDPEMPFLDAQSDQQTILRKDLIRIRNLLFEQVDPEEFKRGWAFRF